MPDRSFYVMAYDIADDRRRAKIARLMEAVAERVQGSVFEAYLTPKELETLLRQARKRLNEKQDSLRVYLLCAACRGRVHTEGVGQVTAPPGVTIV